MIVPAGNRRQIAHSVELSLDGRNGPRRQHRAVFSKAECGIGCCINRDDVAPAFQIALSELVASDGIHRPVTLYPHGVIIRRGDAGRIDKALWCLFFFEIHQQRRDQEHRRGKQQDGVPFFRHRRGFRRSRILCGWIHFLIPPRVTGGTVLPAHPAIHVSLFSIRIIHAFRCRSVISVFPLLRRGVFRATVFVLWQKRRTVCLFCDSSCVILSPQTG